MSLMDIGRGAYARSPKLVRRSLAPLLSLVPTKMKFGRSFRNWRERITLAELDPGYAHAQHIAALRALLRKAHAGSPFYREVIDRHLGSGFDFDRAELEDLRRLPVLRKSALAIAGDGALAVPRSEVDKGITSGSNGERPFSFYLDKDRSAREMAFVYNNWGRVGFEAGMAKIVLRGFSLGPMERFMSEWEPALRELRLAVYPLTERHVAHYVKLINAHRLEYLYGYPSAIELMCRHMLKLGLKLDRPLKGLLPISEPIFEHQRNSIRRALGEVPVAAFYGLSEKAIFADEVRDQPGVYEFSPLYGCAELVDEAGDPVTEVGQEGRLIGTGFLSTGMPFIRYDTEDIARLVAPASPENGQRLRVEQLIPRRKPDFLVSAAGQRVVTTDFTPENPCFFKGIEEYQFFQAEAGKCTIRYMASNDGEESDALRVAADLQRRTENAIIFTVERVDQLAGGRAGKRAYIDQRLDLGKY